jgi:hypothetical protein
VFVAGQPTGSVTITTPQPFHPNGTLIAHDAQPSLTIANSSTASQGNVSYTFELALDAAFGNVVLSRDVPQGSGRTSLQLETVPSGPYFWHVRTNVAETKGVFTEAMTFTIGPVVVIATPQPSSPVNGTIFVVSRPTLTVPNVGHSATTGQFLYQFDIARDAAFVNMIESRVVPEGKGHALHHVIAAAADGVFWRVRVTDSASGSGRVSATSDFMTGTALTSSGPARSRLEHLGTDPMGFHWDPRCLVSFTGVSVSSRRSDAAGVRLDGSRLLTAGRHRLDAWQRISDLRGVCAVADLPANDLIQFEFMCIIHVNESTGMCCQETVRASRVVAPISQSR